MAMVKNPFNGNLNANEIFSAIYNMLISQDVRDPKLANNYNLVDEFRTDGSLYGDTKLFYDVDVLASRPWYTADAVTGIASPDNEAKNLLNVNRPANPKCQAITLDKFRQVDITVDNYLTKRAWSDEGSFSAFNSIILKMLGKCKEVHETTLINSYVGTVATASNVNSVSVALEQTATGEEKARIDAQKIAEAVANTIDDMCDYSRDYNDYKFLRAYSKDQLMVVWNNAWVNKITKVDLPTIYHDTDVFDGFAKKIPARYFGNAIDTSAKLTAISAATPTTGKPINSSTGAYTPGTNHANGIVRSLVEREVTVSNVVYKVLPGDELPAGATVGASKQFDVGEIYVPDATIVCKIISKDAIKFMGAFEVGTEFFNPRSLTENHYLTWGYSNPDYLRGEAIVTVKAQ